MPALIMLFGRVLHLKNVKVNVLCNTDEDKNNNNIIDICYFESDIMRTCTVPLPNVRNITMTIDDYSQPLHNQTLFRCPEIG